MASSVSCTAPTKSGISAPSSTPSVRNANIINVSVFLRKLRRFFISRPSSSNRERNIGNSLLEWPDRAKAAAALIRGLNLTSPRIADYGCGKQTLRRFLEDDSTYIPFDFVQRSPDTRIRDFNRNDPPGHFDVGCCLGVLEYLDEPLRVLRRLIESNAFVVFSYNGPTEHSRRHLEGWINALTFDQLESCIKDCGSTIVAREELGRNERLYLVSGKGKQ